MSDINNLGSFSSIDAVWAQYPEGGIEGDYLDINGVKYRWNKYNQIWENAEVVTESTAKKTETVDGNLTVENNLVVAGTLRAKAVKQPNCGLFTTLDALKAKYPTPEVGYWATVGDTVPAAIYRCDAEGVWTATGETGGIDSMDYDRIDTIEETIESNKTATDKDIASLKTKDTELEAGITKNHNTIGSAVNTFTANLTALGNKVTANKESADSSISELQTKDKTLESSIASVKATMEYGDQALQTQLDTLVSGRASEAIENFNEIIAFLAGVKDNETLTALLDAIRERITTLEGQTATLDSEKCRYLLFDGFVENPLFSEEESEPTSYAGIFFCPRYSKFVCADDDSATNNTYYQSTVYLTPYQKGNVPYSNIIYINQTTGDCYYFKTSQLVNMGIKREEFDALVAKADALIGGMDEYDEVIPVTNFLESGTPQVGDGCYMYVVDEKKLYKGQSDGTTLTAVEVEPSTNKLYIDLTNCLPYIWKGGEMVAIAPKSAPASIFNATTEVPIDGYYELCDPDKENISAVHAAWKAEKAVSGLIISFELSAGIWKTYQYIGKTVTEVNWYNTDNWKDFGSLAAGSETYIVIDALCGDAVGGYYTLSSAVTALLAYQEKTGVSYEKKGLIISYKTAQNEMETKQFQGEVTDFKEVGLWKDFGGGGKLESKDEPEEGGTDAFSTGGAYDRLPVNIAVDTETEGVVKLSLVGESGDVIGDEQQFNVGTGTGGGTATVVSAAFKDAPIYGNAGSEFIAMASVRSVTASGSTEQLNNIEKAELYDRDTGTLLTTFTLNKASSASLTDYDFSFDMSSYMTQAGTRRFKFVFTDDSGNTGNRNLNITAVDVTITSVQTLNYTAATSLEVNGTSKSIPMFKFANNASSINAITEIYLNGAWRTFNEQEVKDTYSVALTFNPNNVLNEKLLHGSYPLRIHGVDTQSGVVGNYLFTSIMVIGTATTPIVAARWYQDDMNTGIKLYESIEIEYAVYDPNTTSAMAQVYLDDAISQSHVAYRNSTYKYTHQVTGVAYDGTKTLKVKVVSGAGESATASYQVKGTVIDALLKSGAIYAFDFASRSNDDSDKSIVSGDYKIEVKGSNYSTTGFTTFLGEKCLRIAEDVTAECNHKPFALTSIENTGVGIQFAFAAKNLPDDTKRLMECYDEATGAGFYVTGKAVGIYCANSTTNKTEERFYKQGEKVTVSIVVEPAGEGLGVTRSGTTYYFIKLYLNGEEVAVIGYTAGQSNLIQDKTITMDGTVGDFYLFYMMAWNDYFQFDQAFQNYLVKLTDTDDMVEEYTFEDVMAAQQVTEYGATTIKSRPQAVSIMEKGMAYFCECPYNGSNIESLDSTTSTSQNMYVTLYYYNPARPYQNFVAYDVRRRNQGTTSAKRPVKNPRYYLAPKNGSTYNKSTKTGGTTMQLISPDLTIEAGVIASELAKCNKMQLFDDSIPIDTITVKLDYSDSSNANDCGVCDQMNATFRALGGNYITPAQRHYDGTWSGKYKENGETKKVELSGLKMNHSTANHPAAMYRSTETSGSNPYFHAKGNWKEDKKEQVALGFKDTPGYTKGCLNYGDFIEYYGKEGETLASTKGRFLQETDLDTGSVYILTQYCGRSYKVMRYVENSWVEQEGSMKMVNGKWEITGDVMNPTDGFELLNYQGMCWFKGVSSVNDLMAPVSTFSKWVGELVDGGDISIKTAPAWTYYFECLLDDDDLAIAYAEGKKVPYNLLDFLVFCNSCDPDGSDQAAALKKWHDELYVHASPYSCMAYDIFTDYDAATDQRAKNMQPMWFLEDGASVVNGVYFNSTTIGCNPVRMYLNKIYDCDTCNGKDNDGGQTVDAETDPNKMTDDTYTNPYAGYGSILFRNMYLQQSVLVAANDTSELNLASVASAMRTCSATVGGVTLNPFSPDGAEYFFLTSRIKRWQKKLSSYDGERKYIQFTGSSDSIYFYALQGLGLTSLPAFIERRWRYRDGFFGCGNFFSGVLSGRVNAPTGARIHIKAAKSGYFGIGNDSSGSITEKVYLEAGEEHYFTEFSHEEGALLYIYQADRMSMLDLSEITLSNTFDFSVMSLVEELRIGSTSYSQQTIGSYQLLTSVSLGELPFLKELHIENTGITNVNCESCPRLESIHAYGSQLQRADIADGAKIQKMYLPKSYNYLKLRYLPQMKYYRKDGVLYSGIEMEDWTSISTLIIENCDNIDAWLMLYRLINNFFIDQLGALKVIRITPVDEKGDGTILDKIIAMNLHGLDSNLTLQEKPAICGKYRSTSYKKNSVIKAWQEALGDDLKVYNALYSQYTISDVETDPKNITNEDNKTGYKYNTDYVPSGYIKEIRKQTVPVSAVLDKEGKGVDLKLLKVSDNSKYVDGTDYDLTDTLNAGHDLFSRFPYFFFKGINDYKNQEKHILLNINYDKVEPLQTWTKKNSGTLSETLYKSASAVNINNVAVGFAFTDDMLTTVASANVHRIDVEGMEQVRYYGLNNSTYGGVFVDANGLSLEKELMANTGVTDSPFDFTDGDYLYRAVPGGAKWFYFTCMKDVDQSLEVFSVDSDDVEAIEPGWEIHYADLVGMYGLSIDSLLQARSLSGKKTITGTGTAETSIEWTYDDEGNPTNTPVGTMNYTYQDMLNLCRCRGEGYHGIGYDQSKILAILSMCYTGIRDDQSVYGFGTSSQYTTGDKNTVGRDTAKEKHSGTNKVWNVEGAIACNWEVMDHIGVNISTWKQWKANGRPAVGTVNDIAHIYDPHTDTERTVKFMTTSGYNIARLRLGRKCDVIASAVSTDNSKWVTGYCAVSYYSRTAGRCVGRASSYAYAAGGLVYANASNASSYSNSSSGSRLAFSGILNNDDEITELVNKNEEEYED